MEQAFRVFTGDFTAWWPHQYHIGQADVAEVILEPHEGGRWYERGIDGNECDWGRVLVWAPPNRLVFTWQISGAWQFDPDLAHASEIEILFSEDGTGQTRVEVEHRQFDRLVDGRSVHDAFQGGGGWRCSSRATPRARGTPSDRTGGRRRSGHQERRGSSVSVKRLDLRS